MGQRRARLLCDGFLGELLGNLRLLLSDGQQRERAVAIRIDRTGAPVTSGALDRLADLRAEWSTRRAELKDIVVKDIEPLNEWARKQGVRHIPVPENL